MEEWLNITAETLIAVINGIAVLIIVFGTIEAFVRGLPLMFRSKKTGREFRFLYLSFGRYLVFGLTFQLAADIVETVNKSDWEDIGKLGAIAIIRTFLSYFLERDMVEVSEALPFEGSEVSTSRNAAARSGTIDADK